MTVLFPNAQLTTHSRAHPAERDAYGVPVLSDDPVPVERGPFAGAVKEQTEQGPWSLRLDPRHWPIRPGDDVTDGTRRWVVQTALDHGIPGYPAVDYIAVIAALDPPEVA